LECLWRSNACALSVPKPSVTVHHSAGVNFDPLCRSQFLTNNFASTAISLILFEFPTAPRPILYQDIEAIDNQRERGGFEIMTDALLACPGFRHR
jgi:hypothetical protein